MFITDDDKELLPMYLRFTKGIMDSEDLPLNVSRELLQDNKILANMKQHSVKKILQSIKKLTGEDAIQFTSQYNKMIKEGIFTDHVNKELLLDIVRYKSSTEEGMVSLESYVSRGDSEQKSIYYLLGDDEKVMRNSPLLEAYKKANIEVLLMDDKDEDGIVTPMIEKYKDWEFKDITAVAAPDSKTDEEKEVIAKEFKTLTDKIKEVLGEEIKAVTTSTRLTDSPSCVIKDPDDPMVAMAGIFAQMGQALPEAKMILEINPEHEMIKKLNTLEDKELFEEVSWVLLDGAKLSEGLEPKDKGAFAARIASLATKAL